MLDAEAVHGFKEVCYNLSYVRIMVRLGGLGVGFKGTILGVYEVRIPGLDVAIESMGRRVVGDSKLCNVLWVRRCEGLALQCKRAAIRIFGAFTRDELWGNQLTFLKYGNSPSHPHPSLPKSCHIS